MTTSPPAANAPWSRGTARPTPFDNRWRGLGRGFGQYFKSSCRETGHRTPLQTEQLAMMTMAESLTLVQ